MDVPALIAHNAPAMFDYGRKALVDGLQDKVGDFAWRQVCRALGRFIPSLKEADPRELRTRLDRLEVTMLGFSAELSYFQAVTGVTEPPDDEMREPTAQDFVTDAFDAAMSSPSTEKQALLGRLIAKRLYTETESSEDLMARESLSIARQANKKQLYALGAIYLIHYPPDSLMPSEDLMKWWDTEYLPMLHEFVGQGWNAADLAYLERLGALSYDQSVDQQALRTHARPGPPINNVLQRHNMGYADTFGARAKKVSEFAIYSTRLHAGSAKTTAWPSVAFALAPYTPTAPGGNLAVTLIDSLGSGRIEEMEHASQYPLSQSPS